MTEQEYNSSPKTCKQCGAIISFAHRENIFCSHSCSATYNNKGMVRNGESRIEATCLNCGKVYSVEKSRRGKFCSRKCNGAYMKKQSIENFISGNITWKQTPPPSVKEYILEEQDNRCAICGMINEWHGKEIHFILDHISGNSTDNSRDNLRFVCPNCDSQLDTYKGRNKNSGRFYRRERYRKGNSY